MPPAAADFLEMFPPGRRRRMILTLSRHPEYDDPHWHGTVSFRCYTHNDGKPGVGHWIETREEDLG